MVSYCRFRVHLQSDIFQLHYRQLSLNTAAAGLPIDRIAADIHVGSGGGIAAAEANFKASPSFNDMAICGEVNAELSAMNRALTEASDINEWCVILPHLYLPSVNVTHAGDNSGMPRRANECVQFYCALPTVDLTRINMSLAESFL